MSNIIIVFLVVLFIVSPAAFSQTIEATGAVTGEVQAAFEASGEAIQTVGKYTIEKGDVLDIFVWNEDKLARQVIVRPDGNISFPLVGEIKAAGSSFEELRDRVAKALKKYINYPVVSVSLVELGQRKVIVLGEVRSPGVYNVSRSCLMLEAIAMAGGFTRDAIKSSVILIRGDADNPVGVRLNLDRTLNDSDLSQNINIQAGDIIYVSETFISNASRFLTKLTDPISDALYIRNNIKDLGR